MAVRPACSPGHGPPLHTTCCIIARGTNIAELNVFSCAGKKGYCTSCRPYSICDALMIVHIFAWHTAAHIFVLPTGCTIYVVLYRETKKGL